MNQTAEWLLLAADFPPTSLWNLFDNEFGQTSPADLVTFLTGAWIPNDRRLAKDCAPQLAAAILSGDVKDNWALTELKLLGLQVRLHKPRLLLGQQDRQECRLTAEFSDRTPTF